MTLNEMIAENLENARANGHNFDLTNQSVIEEVAKDMCDCTDILEYYTFEEVLKELKTNF